MIGSEPPRPASSLALPSFSGAGVLPPLAATGPGPLPALVIFAACTFNAALAAINAHLAPLTPAAVIAAEAVILGAAHLIALAHYRPEMKPWYGLILVFVLCALFRAFGTGAFDPKSLRDVLIIPTFVLLGMTVRTGSMLRLTVVLQAVALLFLALEILNTDLFSALFEIKSYYLGTRGLSEDAFWNASSNLFVSATRPDERFFFPSWDMHRASSIFLEPVSLGNYAVVVTCVLCAFWRDFSPRARAFLVVSTGIIIVGCDGRLAFLSSVLVIGAALGARFLPAFVEGLYIPAAVTFGFLATNLAGWQTGTDDVPGRVALTLDLLARFGLDDFLGLSTEHLAQAVDSGLVYLIATQTVVGVIAIWGFVVFVSARSTVEQVRYTSGLSIFMASNFMVSFSFLSIKTAALLWAVHGALQVVGEAGAAPERTPVPAEAGPRRSGTDRRRPSER